MCSYITGSNDQIFTRGVRAPKHFRGKQQTHSWGGWSGPAEDKYLMAPALSISDLLWLWEKGRWNVPQIYRAWRVSKSVRDSGRRSAAWGGCSSKLQTQQEEIKLQEAQKKKKKNYLLQMPRKKTSALNNETRGWDLSSLTRPVMLDLSKLGIPSLLSFPP